MKKRYIKRRTFMNGLAAAAGSAWLPRMAFAAPPDLLPDGRDVLVCVFLRGGADGLNIIVPHGDDNYYDNRPTLAIPQPGNSQGAAVQLTDFYSLHPSLEPLKELYQEGVFAPVHAVGSHDDTRSHFDAMDFMERGTPGEKSTDTGWLGRHLGSYTSDNESPFRAVGFGGIVQTSLRGPVPATALSSIADFHLRGREDQIIEFQKQLVSLYSNGDFLDTEALGTFDAIEMLQTADPLQYQPENGAEYPEGDFGLALQQVGQLIKAGIGLEIACVDAGGWDTHQGQGGSDGMMAGLLANLAAGLHAFYTDMGSRMSNITLVTMSEFGRRLKENASGGTDHGHAGTMFLLGGGVRGGQVLGTWPGLAAEQLNGPGDLEVTTDFRSVLAEILEKRLLNDRIAEVFPGYNWNGGIGAFDQA